MRRELLGIGYPGYLFREPNLMTVCLEELVSASSVNCARDCNKRAHFIPALKCWVFMRRRINCIALRSDAEGDPFGEERLSSQSIQITKQNRSAGEPTQTRLFMPLFFSLKTQLVLRLKKRAVGRGGTSTPYGPPTSTRFGEVR